MTLKPPSAMYHHPPSWASKTWYEVEAPGYDLLPDAVERNADYGSTPYRFSRMFRAQEWMDTLGIEAYRIFHHAFGDRTLVCAAGHCVNP